MFCIVKIGYIMLKKNIFVLGLGVALSFQTLEAVEVTERPEGAPVIKTVNHDNDWYLRTLHGIPKLYPGGLEFIKDQGNWYTPFNNPGMLRPYDIRGWHR